LTERINGPALVKRVSAIGYFRAGQARST